MHRTHLFGGETGNRFTAIYELVGCFSWTVVGTFHNGCSDSIHSRKSKKLILKLMKKSEIYL